MYPNTDNDKENKKLQKKMKDLTPIQLQQLIIHLKSELSRYKSMEKEQKKSTTKIKIDELKEENKELQNELKQADKLVSIKEQEKATIEQKLLQLEKELQSYKEKEQQAANLLENLQQYKKQAKKLEETNKTLQTKIDAFQKKIVHLESAQIKTEHNNDISHKLENKITEILSLLSPINHKLMQTSSTEAPNKGIEKLFEKINVYFQEDNILKNELTRLTEQNQHDTERIIYLEKAISEVTEKNLHLQQEQERYNQIIHQLQEQEKQHKAQTTQFEKTISEVTEQNLHFQQEKENYNQIICQLREQQKEDKEQIKQFEKNISRYMEKDTQFKQEVQKLHESLIDLTEKESAYIHTIETLNQSLATLAKQEKQYKHEIEQLQERLKNNDPQQKVKIERNEKKSGNHNFALTEKHKNSFYSEKKTSNPNNEINHFRFSNNTPTSKTQSPLSMHQKPSAQTCSLNQMNVTQDNNHSTGLISWNVHNENSQKFDTMQANSIDIFYQKNPLYSGVQKTIINPFMNFKK